MWRLSLQLGSRAPNPGERQDEVSGGGGSLRREDVCALVAGSCCAMEINRALQSRRPPTKNLKKNRPQSAHTSVRTHTHLHAHRHQTGHQAKSM